MKTINAQNLEELGKLYLKHSEQKKKLFGGEKLKLNENEFWFELVSIDWFKKLFNLSIDVTIEDFRYWDSEEEYGFSFNNSLSMRIRTCYPNSHHDWFSESNGIRDYFQ